ncbi:hypothetical protein DPMN_050340 [Dreissena polymorpha]|uniref:Uncharacterized protein n=1 Tax=Dreissena polymorpha TaxID=45954 RepID=A0A9D4CHT4_DREPO|nr:hypothetical protein DPMN_050340 [Dreissena polymorpha]
MGPALNCGTDYHDTRGPALNRGTEHHDTWGTTYDRDMAYHYTRGAARFDTLVNVKQERTHTPMSMDKTSKPHNNMTNHFANYRQELLHHQLQLDLAYTSPDAKNDQVQQQSNRNCHIVHTPHRSGYDGNLEQRHIILPGNVQHNDEHFCIDGYDKHGNTSSNINRNRQNFPTSYRPTTNISIEQNKPSACNYDNVLPTSTYHFPDDSRYLPRDMYRHAPVETNDRRPYGSFAFKPNMAQNRLSEQR